MKKWLIAGAITGTVMVLGFGVAGALGIRSIFGGSKEDPAGGTAST